MKIETTIRDPDDLWYSAEKRLVALCVACDPSAPPGVLDVITTITPWSTTSGAQGEDRGVAVFVRGSFVWANRAHANRVGGAEHQAMFGTERYSGERRTLPVERIEEALAALLTPQVFHTATRQRGVVIRREEIHVSATPELASAMRTALMPVY